MRRLLLPVGLIVAVLIIAFLLLQVREEAPSPEEPVTLPEDASLSAIEEGTAINPDIATVIGGVLNSGTAQDEEELVALVSALVAGDEELYLSKLAGLRATLPQEKPSEVVIRGKRSDDLPYRGLFLDSAKDMRWVLANVDKVKAAGIDTIMMDLPLGVHGENGSLYILGEETYLFYINAFHNSGFRLWLALSPTAYDFPYVYWSDPEKLERLGIPPLTNQSELLEMIKPLMYHWVEISERYNVDTFIPSDEANVLIMDRSYTNTNLCGPERQKMNDWMQEILPQIKQRFYGKVGFATNDGGPCEDQKKEGPKRDAPLFDFSDYDFIIQKIPFPSIFNFPNWTWEQGMDSFLRNTLPLIDQYDMTGLIFYETGDTMGKALTEDFAGSPFVRESTPEDQKAGYEKDFWAMNKSDKILGMFFKIAGPQPHEPDWNPFGRPAEQVLKENFAKYGTLNLTETDKLWIAIGEDGLLAIEICLSKNGTMPFDPYTVLNRTEFEEFRSRVEPLC